LLAKFIYRIQVFLAAAALAQIAPGPALSAAGSNSAGSSEHRFECLVEPVVRKGCDEVEWRLLGRDRPTSSRGLQTVRARVGGRVGRWRRRRAGARRMRGARARAGADRTGRGGRAARACRGGRRQADTPRDRRRFKHLCGLWRGFCIIQGRQDKSGLRYSEYIPRGAIIERSLYELTRSCSGIPRDKRIAQMPEKIVRLFTSPTGGPPHRINSVYAFNTHTGLHTGHNRCNQSAKAGILYHPHILQLLS
jgi:hypothetical protein